MKWLVGKCLTCGHDDILMVGPGIAPVSLTNHCNCPSRMGNSTAENNPNDDIVFDVAYTKTIDEDEGLLAIWEEKEMI